MGVTRILMAVVVAAAAILAGSGGAEAQQTQSRLYDVTKSKKLRVCQFPLYYSISFRNPKTGKIEGIDADLAEELAKELDAKLEIVETSFATFIADLQANKCEIGMFGVGATLKRAQAVEFSKPYLLTNLYAVTRKDSKIKKWEDIDQKGVKAAVSLGSPVVPNHKGFPPDAAVLQPVEHFAVPPGTDDSDGFQIVGGLRGEGAVQGFALTYRLGGTIHVAILGHGAILCPKTCEGLDEAEARQRSALGSLSAFVSAPVR